MSLLSQLAKEVGVTPERLRSALLGGEEALQPNNVIIATDGKVSYDFAGRIHASGLTIDEDTGPTTGYTSINSVGWQDSNDAIREYIKGLVPAANIHQLLLESDDQHVRPTRFTLTSHTDTDEAYIEASIGARAVELVANDGSGVDPVRVLTLTGNDDKSHWLQLVAKDNLKVYAGDFDGRPVGPVRMREGTGFTGIVRAGAGNYQLSHAAVANPLGVTFGAANAYGFATAIPICLYRGISATRTDIFIFDGGVLKDDFFTVIGIG